MPNFTRHVLSGLLVLSLFTSISTASDSITPTDATKTTIAPINTPLTDEYIQANRALLIKQVYDSAYNTCVDEIMKNTKMQSVVTKYPGEFATTTCRCGIDKLKNTYPEENVLRVLKHVSNQDNETPEEKAAGEAIFADYIKLATQKGRECRSEFNESHQ